MKKTSRRLWGAFLAVAMLLTLLPATAFAAIPDEYAAPVAENRMNVYEINGVTGDITDNKVVYTVTSKADTEDWDQDSGEGSNQNYTYVGLYITMPENAVSLQYSDEGDPKSMETVSADSAFLQGGAFQHWFPVAEKKSDGSFSLFYGGRTYTMLLNWLENQAAWQGSYLSTSAAR